MSDDMSPETRAWYLRLAPMQKTSDEMSEEQLSRADWQDGFDYMVRTARVQTAEIERLRKALSQVADSRKGPSNGDPVTLRNIARAALGLPQSSSGTI